VKFSKQTWDQLKNITADELIKSLEKDNWKKDVSSGAELIYRKSDGRSVSIHYHPQKIYGPKLLKSLLIDIGWSEKDMRKLELIK
jgi:predicted RNA binding protein YcfA (HicA-like mRNA interferase family)